MDDILVLFFISLWYFPDFPVKNCVQNSSTLDNQHLCVFFQIICIQSPSERLLNFWLPVWRRINERTLLADISGWRGTSPAAPAPQ